MPPGLPDDDRRCSCMLRCWHSVKRTPGHFQIEKWHQKQEDLGINPSKYRHQRYETRTRSLLPKVASTRKSKKVLASAHQSTGIKDTYLQSSTRPSIQHAAPQVTYPLFLHLGVQGVCASASPFIAPFGWSSIDACSRA